MRSRSHGSKLLAPYWRLPPDRGLADRKAKRDKLQARMKREQPKESKVSEKELRQWAERQFHEIDRLMAERTSELPDRQLVESYVERIEINPHEKTGVIVLRGDLKYVHALSSTHVPNGDFMGAHKWCFYSWQESVGVAAEVEIAKELNKPVRYLDSGTLTNVSEGRIGVSK